MQLGFFFDQSRCSGCFTCITACKQWHSTDYEVMNWRRVETFEKGEFPNLNISFISISCLHCSTPLCASVCPPSAIFKRKQDGIVLVDSEKCLGRSNCELCKDACPYRIPQFNSDHDFKMEKCNLCLDRLDVCPTHANERGEIQKIASQGNDAREEVVEHEIYVEAVLRIVADIQRPSVNDWAQKI